MSEPKWRHTAPKTETRTYGERDDLEEYEWGEDADYGYGFSARIVPVAPRESSLHVIIDAPDCDPSRAREFAESLLALVRRFVAEDPHTYDWVKDYIERLERPSAGPQTGESE